MDEYGRTEIDIPDCLYCDGRLGTEPTKDGMHATCYVKFSTEMERINPTIWPPKEPEFFEESTPVEPTPLDKIEMVF